MIILKAGVPVQSTHGVSVDVLPTGERKVDALTPRMLVAFLSQFGAVRFITSVSAGEHDVIEVLDHAK
jgi:hypothetical protein